MHIIGPRALKFDSRDKNRWKVGGRRGLQEIRGYVNFIVSREEDASFVEEWIVGQLLTVAGSELGLALRAPRIFHRIAEASTGLGSRRKLWGVSDAVMLHRDDD